MLFPVRFNKSKILPPMSQTAFTRGRHHQ